MSRFLAERYGKLSPYVPGEQPQDRQYIKLNTNESPYPPAPGVARVITKGEIDDLRLYPDPEAGALTRALADRLGLAPEEIFTGNGSDEVLGLIFMAFSGKEGVCYPAVSYSFYPVFCALCGVEGREIPMREGLRFSLEDCPAGNSPVVFPNPNAPTGIPLPRQEIWAFLEQNPHRLVVVDEAYVDFGAESCVPLVKEFSNLLVVQTFSKSRCLAGARLGFAAGCRELIADLMKVKFSFNSYTNSRLSLLAGLASLEDEEYFQRCVSAIVRERERTAGRLEEKGFQVLPSKANFLFARTPKVSGGDLYRKLRERGILVRHFSQPAIDDWVRITIGTPEQMDALDRQLDEILKEAAE